MSRDGLITLDWATLGTGPVGGDVGYWSLSTREGFEPQAGDIILAGGHTAMVESYDPGTAIVATIEGNAGSAVRSRNVSLADPDAATGSAWIKTLVRLPVEHFGGGEAATTESTDGDEILAEVRRQVSAIGARMASEGWLADGATGSATETTQTWQGGAYGGSETR